MLYANLENSAFLSAQVSLGLFPGRGRLIHQIPFVPGDPPNLFGASGSNSPFPDDRGGDHELDYEINIEMAAFASVGLSVGPAPSPA